MTQLAEDIATDKTAQALAPFLAALAARGRRVTPDDAFMLGYVAELAAGIAAIRGQPLLDRAGAERVAARIFGRLLPGGGDLWALAQARAADPAAMAGRAEAVASLARVFARKGRVIAPAEAVATALEKAGPCREPESP